LRPGQASHAPHRHPQEELIIVKEGQLEISINGAKQRAGTGSCCSTRRSMPTPYATSATPRHLLGH
jgi:uncharacterized cupin superfamily protein